MRLVLVASEAQDALTPCHVMTVSLTLNKQPK